MICENCGKEHDGTYGSGRFCCKECAKSFSTKNTSGQLKEAKCIDCGKIIYIGKRASLKTCRCKHCNDIHLQILHPRKQKILKHNDVICKICGAKKGECIDNNVCKHYRIFPTLIKFGLDKKKIGTPEIINEYYRVCDIIKYEYQYNRILNDELIKKYNYTSGIANFHKILKSLNIDTLNNSDSTKLAIELGRLKPGGYNNFHEYLHKTWDNKIYHMRSSYEEIYANELDRNKILYEYENLIIKYFDTQLNQIRRAVPDFYIPSTNTIVEIKSTFTLDLKNMQDKKKAYIEQGYNFKLICDFKELEI